MNGGDKEPVQKFGGEIWWKMITQKTEEEIGE